jgi:hypothetical protein
VRLFVLCEGTGEYSGRIIGHQLQQRLQGVAIVDRGSAKKLTKNLNDDIAYDYILNMGVTERMTTYSRPLNAFNVVKHALNRKISRMKLRMKKLPIPVTMSKLENVTTRDLPMIGRSNFSSDEGDLWSCLDLSDVRSSEAQGATHWVEFISKAREFKVHVVAPDTMTYKSKPEEFQVIKVSELMDRGEGNSNLFGDPLNHEEQIVVKAKVLAQLTVSELQMHWGAVTMLADEKGNLTILKVDPCPNLKEDASDTLKKYSYALCKMLGKESKPLILSRPSRE